MVLSLDTLLKLEIVLRNKIGGTETSSKDNSAYDFP